MYATLSDMLNRYETRELIQLTDEDHTDQIAVVTVDRALSDAATFIDSFVSAVYSLPLPSVPDILTQHACAIARYYLWRRKAEMPEAVRLGYDAAAKWLKALADGSVKLEIGGAEAPAAPNTILFNTPDRVFSRDRMKGY